MFPQGLRFVGGVEKEGGKQFQVMSVTCQPDLAPPGFQEAGLWSPEELRLVDYYDGDSSVLGYTVNSKQGDALLLFHVVVVVSCCCCCFMLLFHVVVVSCCCVSCCFMLLLLLLLFSFLFLSFHTPARVLLLLYSPVVTASPYRWLPLLGWRIRQLE